MVRCKICGVEKTLEEYYGHARICKRCICERNSNKKYANNLEKYPDLPNEQWKEIIGYEGRYIVSNKGRIRSMVYGGRRGVILMQSSVKGGYLRVGLVKDGCKRHYLVHRLVAAAFVDNPCCLPTVNHKDFNTQNNNAVNLEWVTQRDNNNYSRAAGHYYYSEKARMKAKQNRKISDDVAMLMYKEYKSGLFKQSELSKKYGVSRAFVCRLIRGKCRTELTGIKK